MPTFEQMIPFPMVLTVIPLYLITTPTPHPRRNQSLGLCTLTTTHTAFLKALTFATFSVMAVAAVLAPAGLLYLYMLGPPVFRGPLSSLSVLLGQSAPEGQKASTPPHSEDCSVVTL